MSQFWHYLLFLMTIPIVYSDLQVIRNLTVLNNSFQQSFREARQVNFKTGIGCGTIAMRPNDVIEVKSNNFRIGNYFNNDACTWTFTASDCDLSTYCPCFNIPGSAGCLEDYLKIGYAKFHDKFCGENSPVGVYRASSDFLTLRFRSDYKETGKGFLCYVRCGKTGTADPVAPPPTTGAVCPAGAINPYGNPQ